MSMIRRAAESSTKRAVIERRDMPSSALPVTQESSFLLMEQRNADDAAEVAFAGALLRIAGDIDLALLLAVAGKAGRRIVLRHHHSECVAALARLGLVENLAAGPVGRQELAFDDRLFPLV